jgi:hypothetical protein
MAPATSQSFTCINKVFIPLHNSLTFNEYEKDEEGNEYFIEVVLYQNFLLQEKLYGYDKQGVSDRSRCVNLWSILHPLLLP